MKTTEQTDNTHEQPIYELKRKWLRYMFYFFVAYVPFLNFYTFYLACLGISRSPSEVTVE